MATRTCDSERPQIVLPELSSRSTTLESTELHTPDEDLASLFSTKLQAPDHASKKAAWNQLEHLDLDPLAPERNHIDTVKVLESRRVVALPATPTEQEDELEDKEEDEGENENEDGISSRDTFDSLLCAMGRQEKLPSGPSLYTLDNAPLLDHHEARAGSELVCFDSRSSLDGVLSSSSRKFIRETKDETLLEDHTLFSILKSQLRNMTLRTAFSLTFKLFCFIPWCTFVGGLIIFRPKSLHKYAFWYTGIPQNGVQRYAHWADVAVEHLVIFLGFVLGLCVLFGPTFSLVLLSTLVTGALMAWANFDRKLGMLEDVPLGRDDRLSVWMVITGYDLEKVKLEIEDGEVYVRGPLMVDDEEEE